MFKFVLCALLAVAVAEPQPEAQPEPQPQPEPGALIAPYAAGAPYYSAPWLAPTITKTASFVQSPYFYSGYASPVYSHFIKKRSAPLLSSTYYAPATYAAAAAPLYTSTYSAPIASSFYSTPVLSTPFGYSHFIKKRSAPLLPAANYYAPTSYSYAASAPFYASGYAGAPIASAQYYPSAFPFAYSSFIKK